MYDNHWILCYTKKCISNINNNNNSVSSEEAAEGAQREKITNFDI